MVEHDDAPLDIDGCVSGDGGIRVIGVFSSKKKAEKAIKKLKNKKGFKRFPKSFMVSNLTVGSYGWVEGFISYEEYLQSISHL